jgi:hypothetical protein
MNVANGSEAQRGLDNPNVVEDHRSLAVIVNDLWEKTELLVRQEMTLGLTEAEERVDILKADLSQRIGELKGELAAKLLAGAVIFSGALAFVAAIILLLAGAMPAWLSALIVGVVVMASGVLLLKRDVPAAPTVMTRDSIPGRTMVSLEKDASAMKETVNELGR